MGDMTYSEKKLHAKNAISIIDEGRPAKSPIVAAEANAERRAARGRGSFVWRSPESRLPSRAVSTPGLTKKSIRPNSEVSHSPV